jgi:hypothetical protein
VTRARKSFCNKVGLRSGMAISAVKSCDVIMCAPLDEIWSCGVVTSKPEQRPRRSGRG